MATILTTRYTRTTLFLLGFQQSGRAAAGREFSAVCRIVAGEA
ncbi:hypothetical protein [Rhodoglobus sp.]